MKLAPGVFACSLIIRVLGSTYSLTSGVVGEEFLSAFKFENIPDPTHGRVNYIDKATAQALNLVRVSDNTFSIHADNTTVLSASDPGRKSFRIRSIAEYTTHVAVFEILHAPVGCGTWPAIWETASSGWPRTGEIDIYEGVNDQPPNLSSVHTGPGCSMTAHRNQTGTALGNDCNVFTDGNSGCGVHLAEESSFGPQLNKQGGGWYAMERSPASIKVWFWQRGATNVPADILNAKETVDPDNWGIPSADFPSTNCDFSTHLARHSIIIDLTFCGDWAGAAYASSGCPSTCVDHVNDNPSAFTNAFFQFASINVYEPPRGP